jgi:hypothetical protein
MLKLIFLILIFILLSLFSAYLQDNKSPNQTNIIGKWKVDKRIVSETRYSISEMEANECLGHEIIFTKDSIISSHDSCFYGYGCTSPNYSYKKVNTLKFFDNDTAYLNLIGYKKDSMEVIITSCGVPFAYVKILGDNKISIAADDYTYFLTKENK